jgi:hypothetical protein
MPPPRHLANRLKNLRRFERCVLEWGEGVSNVFLQCVPVLRRNHDWFFAVLEEGVGEAEREKGEEEVSGAWREFSIVREVVFSGSAEAKVLFAELSEAVNARLTKAVSFRLAEGET